MTDITKEQIVKLYAEMIASGDITRQEVHKNNKLFEEQYIQYYISKEDYIPKERITPEMGLCAYTYILDTGASAEEALIYAANIHGKTEDFVDYAKNLDHYPARQVYESANDHEQQKKMKRNGTLRTKTLTSAKTANKQLRELRDNKKVSDTLEELLENDKSLQEQVDNLTTNTNSIELDINYLKNELNLSGMSKQDKAKRLKELGHTQKQIAECLEVGLSTIKRWWSKI